MPRSPSSKQLLSAAADSWVIRSDYTKQFSVFATFASFSSYRAWTRYGYGVTRPAVILGLLLALGCAAQASDVYRHEVDRGSNLEKELGYRVLVQDESDEKRSKGPDKVIPIKAAAPRYVVEFRAKVIDKLKDLFELDLTLGDANGMLVQVPLSIGSMWNNEKEVDVQFLIRKDLINQAVLAVRCAPRISVHPEFSYAIRLGDYAPGYEPTETQRIAELRKRHPDLGLLAWHRRMNPPDSSNSLSALAVAQKSFLEVNFIGLSRAGLLMLLGPADASPLSLQNSVTYTFEYTEQFVIHRFHFDSEGNVESVEKLPTQ